MPLALAKIDNRSRSKPDSTDARRAGENQSALSHPVTSNEALGADLKAARLGRQATLEQIAKDTHISLRHLQNLEEGRYRDLPGGMYNRAFLRTYCIYLGLDPAGFLERFEEESVPLSERVARAKARTVQMPSRSFRIPPVLIWSVMLLASIVGLYFSRGWISAVFSPYLSRPPAARLPAPEPAPPPKPTQVAATTPAATTVPATAAAPVPAETNPPSGAAQPAAAEPAPGAIHLEFQATQDCWMSVTSDGARVPSKILKPGESESFDAKVNFDIVLGNAGGVNLKINGKPAKPLGKPGEVLKLRINAQNIQDLLEKSAS